MKNIFKIIFLIVCNSLIAQIPDTSISPMQSGAYMAGIAGVRDYANPGVDGLIIVDYNIFLNSDSFYDRNGDKVKSIDLIPELGDGIPIDIDITGYVNSLMLTYASPKISALGNAQYLFIVAPNYTTANARVGLGELINGGLIKGGASGMGDLTVAPFMLSWGSEKFDFTGGYMFVAPTGKYEEGADDNIGIGFWSHIIQAAAYYYPLPEKATALLLMPSYEFHGNLKGADVKAGSRFTLEYGISQYLSDRFEITVQGGNTWQLSEDSGDDVYWDASVKDKVGVVGAGLGYWFVPDVFYTNAKYSTTYGHKQNFGINSFQVELLIIPNWLNKKTSKEQ